MSVIGFYRLVHEDARRRAAAHCMNAPEGCEVIVREKRRDGDTNAALHAMLSEIAKRREWAGQKLEAEAWKRLFVAAWTRATRGEFQALPALDGNGMDMVFRQTSSMSKREVIDLMAYIEAWDAQQ